MRRRSDIRSGGPSRNAKTRETGSEHTSIIIEGDGRQGQVERQRAGQHTSWFALPFWNDPKRPSASAADKEMRATLRWDITDSSRVLKQKAEKELGIRLREKCQPIPSRNKWTERERDLKESDRLVSWQHIPFIWHSVFLSFFPLLSFWHKWKRKFHHVKITKTIGMWMCALCHLCGMRSAHSRAPVFDCGRVSLNSLGWTKSNVCQPVLSDTLRKECLLKA